MEGPIPDKKYFKIGEVGRLTGLDSHVLRFWQSEFDCIRPRKDSGNQRLYTRSDIETIFEIKRLLYEEKYTIPGARKRLSKARKVTAKQKHHEVKGRIRLLKDGLEEIKKLLS